jgi:hypothetical protein
MEKFVNHLKTNPEATSQFIVGVMKQNYSNQDYWEEVCPGLDFSNPKVETWVLDNIELFNLKYLVHYAHGLSPSIIDWVLLNLDQIEPDDLIRYQHLSSSQLESFVKSDFVSGFVNWSLIQEFQHLTQEFVTKYEEFLDWDLISEFQFMDLKFLLTNKSKISWHLVPTNIHFQQIINPSFLKMFGDTNIWDGIGWLDSDIITLEMLVSEYIDYLTLKSIKSIQRAKGEELELEENKQIKCKLEQKEHDLRVKSRVGFS